MRVAGFGFRKGAGVESFLDALALAGQQVDALATVDSKSEGLNQLSLRLNLPVIAVLSDRLSPRPGSERVRQLYGTGSVAEGAALAAAGVGAVLVVGRVASSDGQAVVAIAHGQGEGVAGK